MKAALRDYDLPPTDHHAISSFRRTFEKRMLEAGLDFEVRCRLMRHATGRPPYGDGGAIAFRRDELMKIAFPYSEGLFRRDLRRPMGPVQCICVRSLLLTGIL